MKSKKGAFANSTTGYGKSIKSNHQRTNKQNVKEVKEDENKSANDVNTDLNSGFGDYLRSPEAVEMMKLFVFANSIMLILTMAWPNIKEQYYVLRHWLSSFQEN